MAAVHTAQANFGELTRCNDRTWRTAAEQNLDHKAGQADLAIAENVDRALWDDGVLRSTDYREINIVVKGGVVYLRGHVISAANQRRAESSARTAKGVVEVKSYLVSDEKLILEVAGALGKIERIYGVKFFTGAQNGVVILNGEVSGSHLRKLAEKCAAEVPGVRGVINYVRSPDFDLQTEDHHFYQPVIGGQVYFRNDFLGTIQSVIINPNNRRVVSLIVQRQAAETQPYFEYGRGGKSLLPAGLVVVPMDTIRFVTKGSGVLYINSAESTEYIPYDAVNFVAPEEHWTPPYPYCVDEVFFAIESVNEMNPTEAEAAVPWTRVPVSSGIPA